MKKTYMNGLQSSPTDVTALQQTEDSSPVASSSPDPEKETPDHLYIPHESKLLALMQN